MKRLASSLLIVVGLINLFPVLGIVSAEKLSTLYGIGHLDGDMLILMRHRALLFGILGTFIIYSAFKTHLRPAAIAMGLVSMLGFTALVLAAGEHGAKLGNVAIIDVIASVALCVAAAIFLRTEKA